MKTQRRLIKELLLKAFNNYSNNKTLQIGYTNTVVTNYDKSHLLHIDVRVCQGVTKKSTNKQIMLETLIRTLTGHY